MPLLPEESRNPATSIPVEQLTSNRPVSQAQSDMLYRGSSACSSASSSLTSLTSTSGPSLSDCPTKDQSCLSHNVHRRDKKEEDQQEQVSNRIEFISTISSASSSDSSTNEESLQTESHHIDDNDENNNNNHNNNKNTKNTKMLSLDNISSSSSSSSIDSFTISASDEAPMLPPRSARRVSRLTMPIPPKKTTSSDQPMLPHAAPHQLYLSSEEDASSSADDFSDFADELDSDSEKSERRTDRRVSREDTARMVSVIFYGKPSIVTMCPRRSISPSSSTGQAGTNILRTTTEPVLSRPRSISPSCSTTTTFSRPPRSSSMMTAGGIAKKRPGFLQLDPYAKGDVEPLPSARTPKTPTAMFRKTLNLVKKRSKHNLQQSESRESHLLPMEQVGEAEEERDPRESICMEPPTPALVSYQDIIRNAKRNTLHPMSRSEASSPKSPRPRFRSGLSLSRQRSLRA
ncbi:hypothetical protein E4U54_003105 [Claviceps lovelessii]|nr:hypothetical protein E4U54_003105 [Claviceps lovelessii]